MLRFETSEASLGLARSADGVSASRAQRHQSRLHRAAVLIPVAAVFRKKPGRGEILAGCSKGSNSLGNTSYSVRSVAVVHRKCRAARKNQHCCYDWRASYLHVYLIFPDCVVPDNPCFDRSV